ncbi:MAG: hypothetical protein Q8N08_05320 [Methanobacteriaceae archaeon]|nr:hypothetical protein [Methanobacteriaceae archaeon]
MPTLVISRSSWPRKESPHKLAEELEAHGFRVKRNMGPLSYPIRKNWNNALQLVRNWPRR